MRFCRDAALCGIFSLAVYFVAPGKTVCLDGRPQSGREFIGAWAYHDPVFLLSLLFAGLMLGFALTAFLYAVCGLVGRRRLRLLDR